MHRWEDNNEIDLKQIWWDGVKWINLAQDTAKWQALVNTIMKIQDA
jgi:hypothetical protein